MLIFAILAVVFFALWILEKRRHKKEASALQE